jgi:N-acetylmuramic acid 6-phosphate etherase
VSASDHGSVPSRAHISTEAVNPHTEGLDQLTTEVALERIQAEDARLHAALTSARPSIAAAIELIHPRLARGGRLIYVGAGTSGRLGVLDAVECPPTFQSDEHQIQGLLAGGRESMFRSSEDAEDSLEAAAHELAELELGVDDVVFGISAGGTTPYVHGALRFAREVGAASVMLACVPFEETPDEADVSIRVITGPEILQGSTRLKAGTATKLVLNCVSTLVMVRLGKVHGNRMVDVNTAGNAKLLDRGIRLVQELCQLDRSAAAACLEAADGQVKLAVLMHSGELGSGPARRLLEEHQGQLAGALKSALN